MPRESGNISVQTENIFPIIKKWLYSEKDIFIREMVSNANDAIVKLKKLISIGEAEVDPNEKFYIKVIINKDEKTIKIVDNGIGMTAEEVKRYINQIAFSGAVDFLEKYKDKTDESSQIIGHFGLGFYSAFMVSDKVTIDTLSWQAGAVAVKWTSTGGQEFEMDDSDQAERGTVVTLYLSEDSLEYLDYYKMKEMLEKYCSFLPIELYLEDASKEAVKKKKEAEKDGKKEEPKPINDTHPLWLKSPKDCTDEEYKEFYQKVFHDFKDPLFWIHLNMDYPFNLKGILYFPKLKHEYETIEGQIKLYYNQVFVADNIKEVIPEFLMLLKGVIDCPDLPLNVSRSFLQNDGYVNKISTHITKKVADKLTSLFESDRESYNKYWDDINPFVKYGCIREPKFFDRVKDAVVYKTTEGDFVTLKEYREKTGDTNKDRVFYVTDEKQQAQYIKMFKEYGIEPVIMNTLIDNHFMQFMETKDNGVKFTRVDSDISDIMKDSENKEDNEKVTGELEKIFRQAVGNDKLKVQVEALKSTSIPGMILLPEQSRRFQELSKMYGFAGLDAANMFEQEQALVLNSKNSLIKAILKLSESEERKSDMELICQHVYDLAILGHKQLEPAAMTKFIERNNILLERIANLA